MIYTLFFNMASGLLDGTTLVNLTLPAADDATGVIQIPVTGNMGGVDPAMLQPIVGIGGYLVCGIGMSIGGAGTPAISAGILGRTSGNVAQRVPGIAAFATNLPATQPPYVERPFYVPPNYRLWFLSTAVGAAAHVIRLDIAPIRTTQQAARALRVTRPNLLTPIAFP